MLRFDTGHIMQALLEHFITQSTVYSLIAVMLVAFLESLALVGLILPGTVMMAGLGALIGSGDVNFWQAWLAGIIGCLLGDWISFWLGWRFKKPLHRWSFMKKNKALLDKTEHALHQHSMITILIGRFVGPTRPLVPMSPACSISRWRSLFCPILLVACCGRRCTSCRVFWPARRLIFPPNEHSGSFKWLLLAAALLVWLAGWLCWRLWRSAKMRDRLTRLLPRSRLLWLTPVTVVLAGAALTLVIRHPLMPVYLDILHKVIAR
ncbi:Inner membrane protein yabI [Raoultella planticola]|uniref:Inner membrane protein yabI n=1 Tax=Raoultella planticola TaxID=575 RepID=A0A485B4U1_RAOPL|nr:Inner membrane protein yabI [Raoultella planticola]